MYIVKANLVNVTDRNSIYLASADATALTFSSKQRDAHRFATRDDASARVPGGFRIVRLRARDVSPF